MFAIVLYYFPYRKQNISMCHTLSPNACFWWMENNMAMFNYIYNKIWWGGCISVMLGDQSCVPYRAIEFKHIHAYHNFSIYKHQSYENIDSYFWCMYFMYIYTVKIAPLPLENNVAQCASCSIISHIVIRSTWFQMFRFYFYHKPQPPINTHHKTISNFWPSHSLEICNEWKTKRHTNQKEMKWK